MPSKPNVFQRGPVVKIQPRHSPESQAIYDRMAFLVGVIAFGLPLILLFGGTFGGSCFRDSISHFYYAPFLGAIFVGLLFFIGGFLIAYSGDHWIESTLSTVAGLWAIGVALFPTSGSGCEGSAPYLSRIFVQVTNPSEVNTALQLSEATTQGQGHFALFGTASDLHMLAAGLLFIYLGIYCLVVLRRIIPQRHYDENGLLKSKGNRNTLYTWCGLTILLCVAILGLRRPLGVSDVWWNSWNLTFWFELAALWAFGLAWVTKGRFFSRLND